MATVVNGLCKKKSSHFQPPHFLVTALWSEGISPFSPLYHALPFGIAIGLDTPSKKIFPSHVPVLFTKKTDTIREENKFVFQELNPRYFATRAKVVPFNHRGQQPNLLFRFRSFIWGGHRSVEPRS